MRYGRRSSENRICRIYNTSVPPPLLKYLRVRGCWISVAVNKRDKGGQVWDKLNWVQYKGRPGLANTGQLSLQEQVWTPLV